MVQCIEEEDVPDPIRRLLIANRGEIAVRVIRTCRRLGIETVAVFSEADRAMPHVRLADQSVCIGPAEPHLSYLNIDALIDACKQTGAGAVHPGYGFLSENAKFAESLLAAGITFVGPRAETMRAMGDKIAARKLMEQHGVPVVPGYHGQDQSATRLKQEVERIGYPLLVKAAAGGGGRGMRLVEEHSELESALDSARREAQSAFGDDTVFLERFVRSPRHIEIQVFGDLHGNVVHLFERDCSVQRRHQKVIEESPSPALSEDSRTAMAHAAVEAARAVHYEGAGTVEFIYSAADASFYFLEMNTRLQVEHPVTELVTGLDLVEEQIRVAEGKALSFSQESLRQTGHAIEVRLYAEDPTREFLPATGPLHCFEYPDTVRVDSGVESGSVISIFYDPMIAKVIAHSTEGRAAAIESLRKFLGEVRLFGPANNLEFLRAVLDHPEFQSGDYTTQFIPTHFPRFRGPRLAPGEVELARVSAGLLFFHGARNVQQAGTRASISTHGGDLAPWGADLEGFQIW